jgi:Tol biopolymer transport system component
MKPSILFLCNGDVAFYTNGLYYYDLQQQKIVILTDDEGAGYQPQFSEDGTSIIYRTHVYKRYRKYSSLIKLDLESNEKTVLVSEKRNLSTPVVSPQGNLLYTLKNKLNMTGVLGNTVESNAVEISFPVVFIEKRKIAIYRNGQKELLEPLGPGIYVWPSISPDGTKLLFTKAGEGSFISDFDGNILVELGYANAPQWSPDGEWIVFMVDQDDGYVYTASEIYMVDSNGNNRMALTDSEKIIEMYPSWGNTPDKIVYSTNSGRIFLMELAKQ